MNAYVIFRHGMNAANQDRLQQMAVAIVEADSAEQAVEIADSKVLCYNNQCLSAKLASKCSTAVLQDAQDEQDSDEAWASDITKSIGL